MTTPSRRPPFESWSPPPHEAEPSAVRASEATWRRSRGGAPNAMSPSAPPHSRPGPAPQNPHPRFPPRSRGKNWPDEGEPHLRPRPGAFSCDLQRVSGLLGTPSKGGGGGGGGTEQWSPGPGTTMLREARVACSAALAEATVCKCSRLTSWEGRRTRVAVPTQRVPAVAPRGAPTPARGSGVKSSQAGAARALPTGGRGEKLPLL